VRPLSSLRLAIAVAGLRTRCRHVCDCVSASLAFSSGSATAFGGALARNHGSCLLPLRLPFAHKPAVPLFGHRRHFGRLTSLACSRILPETGSRFVTLFSVFTLAVFLSEPPEPPAPCWRTVATLHPLGDCDSPGFETFPGYLTRLGTVSNRSWPLSPFFAFADDARTPPEELVNSASSTMPCGFLSEGLRQPAWHNLSPVAWDHPSEPAMPQKRHRRLVSERRPER